jgi:hypothetical protein
MHDDIYLTSEPGMIPEDALPELLWFSYLHVNGTIITKRYLSWADYIEAGDSPFVKFITRIYEAPDSLAANAIGIKKLRSLV